jgi:hypothetical protein
MCTPLVPVPHPPSLLLNQPCHLPVPILAQSFASHCQPSADLHAPSGPPPPPTHPPSCMGPPRHTPAPPRPHPPGALSGGRSVTQTAGTTHGAVLSVRSLVQVMTPVSDHLLRKTLSRKEPCAETGICLPFTVGPHVAPTQVSFSISQSSGSQPSFTHLEDEVVRGG